MNPFESEPIGRHRSPPSTCRWRPNIQSKVQRGAGSAGRAGAAVALSRAKGQMPRRIAPDSHFTRAFVAIESNAIDVTELAERLAHHEDGDARRIGRPILKALLRTAPRPASFAGYQLEDRTQNSLPSGSARTTHEASR